MSQKEVDEFLGREVGFKLWLEHVTGAALPNDYWDALTDGVLLCDAMLEVRERSIPHVARPDGADRVPFFKVKNNIRFFLAACDEELFIPKRELFEVLDLAHKLNIVKVLHSLFWFANNAADSGWAIPLPTALDEETYEANVFDDPKRLVHVTEQLRLFNEERDARFRRMTLAMGPGGRRRGGVPMPGTAPAAVDLKQYPKAVLEKVGRAITPLQAVVRGNIARARFLKIVRKEAYRKNVAQEMLTTERTYCKSMKFLLDEFLKPLRASQQVVDFGPLEEISSRIHECSARLLAHLEERVGAWSHRQLVGDVFLLFTEQFKSDYEQYVMEYSPMIMTLVEARQNRPFYLAIKDVEEGDAVKSTGLMLESYLIMPVQRIPRYVMLLRDMGKHTKDSHADHGNLAEAAAACDQVAAYINQKQVEHEATNKVVELKMKFGDQLETPETGVIQFIRPHRRFVAEENFHVTGKLNEQLWLYLLNDLLICGMPAKKKGRQQNKQGAPKKWDVHSILRPRFVHCQPGDDRRNCDFKIIEDTGGEVLLALTARSAGVRDKWIASMKDTKLAVAKLEVSEDEVSRERRPSVFKRALADDAVSWAKPDIPDEIKALLGGGGSTGGGDSGSGGGGASEAAGTPTSPSGRKSKKESSDKSAEMKKRRKSTRMKSRIIPSLKNDDLARVSSEELMDTKKKRRSMMQRTFDTLKSKSKSKKEPELAKTASSDKVVRRRGVLDKVKGPQFNRSQSMEDLVRNKSPRAASERHVAGSHIAGMTRSRDEMVSPRSTSSGGSCIVGLGSAVVSPRSSSRFSDLLSSASAPAPADVDVTPPGGDGTAGRASSSESAALPPASPGSTRPGGSCITFRDSPSAKRVPPPRPPRAATPGRPTPPGRRPTREPPKS